MATKDSRNIKFTRAAKCYTDALARVEGARIRAEKAVERTHAAAVKALRAEIVGMLRHGSPTRLSRKSVVVEGYDVEVARRAHLADVLQCWIRVTTAQSKGIDTTTVEALLADREATQREHDELWRMIYNARSRQYAARKAAEAREKRIAAARERVAPVPLSQLTDEALARKAKESRGDELDAIWREARRRDWTRRQMTEVFG